MFARILEMETKPGQARALCAAAEREILPLVGKHPGLVDVMWMIPDDAHDSVVAVSWWKNKEAAEKYRTEGYGDVERIYQPFIKDKIRVRNCEITVAPGIKARKAAA